MDLIGRLLGTYHAIPSPNGNGAATAVPVKADVPPEAKGVTIRGAPVGWFSPDGRALFGLSDVRPDVFEINRHTAFAAAVYAYAAITYRAEKISEPPLMVVEEDDEGVEEWIADHPLSDLLDEPSPDMDMGELLYLTRIYRDITGGALWVLNRDLSGSTGMVTVFSHDEFEVQPDTVDGTRRIFGRFIVRTRDGQREYRPDEVVYFREPNPNSWARPLAPLDVALGVLNMGQQATATVKDILRNALFPSVIIQADKEWAPSDQEFERWKALLEAYARRENKGKPLALTGGGSAEVVSFSLRDLMPGDVLDRVEATVAAAFRIPPVVLGFLVGLKNSPWSQMAEARRMTYEDTIEPMWRRDEKTLTRQWLRLVDPNPRRMIRFDTSKIRALQLDRAKMAEIAEKTRDVGTVNERRALLGWEPLEDERGDVIVGDRPAVQVDFRQPDAGKAESKGALSPEAKTNLWYVGFDVATKAQEPVWRAAVAEQLERDRDEIGRLAVEYLQAGKQESPPDAGAFLRALGDYLDGPAKAAWLEVVAPLLASTGEAAVKRLAAELGVAWDVLQPGLLDYTQREAAWLITQVTDTTKQAVRDALAAGLEAGEGIDGLVKRIRESDAAFGKSRAELIARTETTRVTNGAQQESLAAWAEAEGARVTKTWLATMDSRTRDEHAALSGTTVEIDATFPNGLKAPGEPNCRCTLLYSVED